MAIVVRGPRIRLACSWLAASSTALAALGAQGCGGSPPPKVADHVNDNCKTNLEMAQADLKFCSEGKTEACENVRKDVKQVAALKTKNQALADEASQRVGGCDGKSDADPECKAAADAIAKLDCSE